jgi:tRNA dimethylallyltransferase
MVEKGWVEEVRSLLSRGYSPALRSMRSLGYRHIVSYLQEEIDFPRAVLWTKRDTRRYAKRQITWFKSDPEIEWFPAEEDLEAEVGSAVEDFLSQC